MIGNKAESGDYSADNDTDMNTSETYFEIRLFVDFIIGISNYVQCIYRI